MTTIHLSLDNLQDCLPDSLTEDQKAKAKTLFFKKLALEAHQFYQGKIQILPKIPIPGYPWFNVWYTPGVSAVSTTIRDCQQASFQLSNRSNLVAVLSDSTRVLGDGDCTPAGGLGVMEGKAFLMKYLGGIDAVAMCMDSRNHQQQHDADAIIEFALRMQPSFGAINLEDISQPNCFKVLDVLREKCQIPVWHDDAQGTACVILAGLINALKLAEKQLNNIKIVLYGAGAANSCIARLLMASGANPDTMILFDKDGTLHKNRIDYQENPDFYIQWNLCQKTNKEGLLTQEEAFKDADVLIALSAPGPDTIKSEWIRLMNSKAIVFTCSNPVPEIYPYKAKEAGAFIVATGRGDFPNQVNNSICFPAILKGTLLVESSKITDAMAITAAESIAKYAENQDLSVNYIVPDMMEVDMFPQVAADVAMQAVKEGVARKILTREQVYTQAKQDIFQAREMTNVMIEKGFVKNMPLHIIERCLEESIQTVIKN